ncbi:hypothetical protein OG607_26375 [Streptomyces sp. NBC_01537]|uniref:hypothetical protein n=1 Tax=Streptomyces sp. NBC_01537 TaxID=2903896 RepID=UPI00386A40F5
MRDSRVRTFRHLAHWAGVDAAFVYAFARWDVATTALHDPEDDFDASSFGVVRLGWEPKAAGPARSTPLRSVLLRGVYRRGSEQGYFTVR